MGVMKDLYYATREKDAVREGSHLIIVLEDGTIDGSLLKIDEPGTILMLKPVLSEDLFDYCREVSAMGHSVHIHVSGEYPTDFDVPANKPDAVKDVWSAIGIISEM